MTKFSRVQAEAAKALAVRYAAFCEARTANDDLGLAVWGDMLLESQEETGIRLVEVENTHRLIDAARRQSALKAA